MQLDRVSAHRSLRSVYCTGSYEEIGTDDNRMVQGVVTTAGAEELPILTVRFFAESTVPHEVDCCHGEG